MSALGLRLDPRGYTYTEEWRRICEARTVLRWPLEKRRAHIAAVEKIRGSAAAEQLKKDIITEWERQKNERSDNIDPGLSGPPRQRQG